MNLRAIRSKANRLVKFFGTRNPRKIAEGLGVTLVIYPLDKVRGFYQYFERVNLIYVDERLSEHEQLLVIAHELGHMLLHRTVNIVWMNTHTHFKSCESETEANIFAMELLVPNEIILENIYYTTGQLARLLGYSEELIELRLKTFNIL